MRMTDDLLKAIRHDTLKAIENGEAYLKTIAASHDKTSEDMQECTERFVRHLKEELERWERKKDKARAKATKAHAA
jgi:hypothetical protein